MYPDHRKLKPRIIIILGSTGFLGPYLIESLLSADENARIICINRGLDSEERTLSTLQPSTKETAYRRLQFVVADIGKPRYGLTVESLRKITTDVKEVIFNAWNPNWSLPLDSFAPLLNAVQYTIQICLSMSKPPRIVFISSICAIGEWPRNHAYQQVIPEDITMDRSDAMSHGYGESKLIAETLLANANTVSNIPIAVVRAGQIGGSVSKGHRAWPVQRWILAIIRASNEIGYWPSHVQPLDWIPVDALAEAIAAITSTNPINQQLQVYNMVHPQPAPWRLLFTTLQERFNLSATEIGLPEWLDLLAPEYFKLHTFLRTAGRGREFDMLFETHNASKFLPRLSPISMDQIEMWLEEWALSQPRCLKFKSKM